MEVYKITCRDNGKVYVGSTIHDKYIRWSSNKSSHLRDAFQLKLDKPLYSDIRKYGKDSFDLETLEYLPEDTEVSVLRNLEDFWIKKYVSEGYDMYNLIPSANPWWSKEGQELCMKRRKDKYGDAGFNLRSSEIQRRAVATRISRYGSNTSQLNTPESQEKKRRSQSLHLLYEGNVYYGSNELCDYLNSQGVAISRSSINRLAHGSNIKKFQNLVGKITILDK